MKLFMLSFTSPLVMIGVGYLIWCEEAWVSGV